MFNFKAKLVEASWASRDCLSDSRHFEYVRELMSYHCLCPTCNRLISDLRTGQVLEEFPNSALHWSRVYEWPWVIEHGFSGADAGDDVLDAGGGHAVLQYALAKRFRGRVVNLDTNEESLRAGGTMARLLALKNLEHVRGDIAEIPYPDGRFGTVFCVSVLEHTGTAWREIVNELFRVTKPGGSVLITLDVMVEGDRAQDGLSFDEMRELISVGGEVLPTKESIWRHWVNKGKELLCCLCLKFVKSKENT